MIKPMFFIPDKTVHVVMATEYALLIVSISTFRIRKDNPYVLAYGTEDELVRSAISTSEYRMEPGT